MLVHRNPINSMHLINMQREREREREREKEREREREREREVKERDKKKNKRTGEREKQGERLIIQKLVCICVCFCLSPHRPTLKRFTTSSKHVTKPRFKIKMAAFLTYQFKTQNLIKRIKWTLPITSLHKSFTKY